jgi:hypothetical protein
MRVERVPERATATESQSGSTSPGLDLNTVTRADRSAVARVEFPPSTIVIWSIRRHRAPVLQIESDWPIDKLVPSLAGLTLCTAVAGNSVEVLENGAFFDVLVERIRAARHSVHFETFPVEGRRAGPTWRGRALGELARASRCA